MDPHSPVYLYGGEPASSAPIHADTFSKLIRPLSDDLRTYFKFYSGSRVLREVTFADYARGCCGLARILSERFGMEAGQRVIVRLGNTDKALFAYGAMLAFGVTIVAVDPSESGRNLLHMVEDSGATGVVSLGPEAELEQAALWHCVLSDDMLEEALADDFSWPDHEPERSDLALIVYTSGTTGLPKGVPLTHEKILVNAEGTKRVHAMDEESVHMCVLPLFHVNAFCFSFSTTLYCRSRLILNKGFYLPAFWDILERESVEIASLVPAIIKLLAEDRRKIGIGDMPATLKYFVTAAAPLQSVLANEFFNRYGVRINQAYGLSEAVNFSLTFPPDADQITYEAMFLKREFPAAGCSVWGNDMGIMSPQGELLPPGELGEVVVRGWNVMEGYLNRAEENLEAFKYGWFHTGDTGLVEELDGRRFFFLKGRIKEIAIRKGENISLAGLDAVINRIPGLEEAVTVGFGNEYVGEEIGLFVVPGDDATGDEEELLAACRSALGRELAPKVVIFGEAMPRTSTGKLKRNQLKAAFQAYGDASYA